jgi:hypothetical protein
MRYVKRMMIKYMSSLHPRGWWKLDQEEEEMAFVGSRVDCHFLLSSGV